MFAKNKIHPSLRFKRWSRKSYAIFCSIGRHVTIGNLKNIIADTLLRKQRNIFSVFIDVNKVGEQEVTPLSAIPPDDVLQLELHLIPQLQNHIEYCGYAAFNNNHKYFLWLKASIYKAFSHFHF